MMTFQKLLKHTDLVVGLGLLAIVAMLILPLPHWALDTGLVGAIAASVIILLMAVNVSDPLQFSALPSILLITTLSRLALSIAATKLILGTGQAGHVIGTFGDFVMGGDPVVGFVTFLILVIVQFVVITNGAGRVSEVVARFTLDSMPGKQMAIDADLAAGLIDEHGARERRKLIKKEADFYGAMDGASKFVKGDAIAAILIIAVNIIAGFVVGFMRGSGDAMQILKQYTVLSVGEGLVSQLPALLISTASGLMVTRAGQDRSMGGEVAGQVFNQPKAIGVAGLALALLAIVPGFPATIFLLASGACFGLYRFLIKNPDASKMFDVPKPKPKAVPKDAASQGGPEAVLPLLAVDPIEIEIGYGLTKLADTRVGGDLPDRVAATRRQIALELGFVMPTVRIRDSVNLEPNEYMLKIRGEEVAKAQCMPSSLLAVSPGTGPSLLPGMPTKDPVFNLDSVWIEPNLRETAERTGYTVIEPAAVISTHLAEVVKQYAAELITRQDVQTLVDNAKLTDGSVVAELIPNVLQIGDVQKVLQHLLRERVPVRDIVTILETMADYGTRIKDPEPLGEIVRAAIARTITRQYVDQSTNRLSCITLEPALERDIVENLHIGPNGTTLVLDADKQAKLIEKLQREADSASGKGLQPVLICSTQVRLPLRKLLERHIPTLHVLAYNEIAARADVEFVGQVRQAA
jgi:flagellar biosynthesis protein FlhA